MSSDREPILGYESGRLFNIATVSTMDRLFRRGYSPVASERWIDEETLTTPENKLLGFHRPESNGPIWTPKRGEEGKVSTVYLLNLTTQESNQPFYLIPQGSSQDPSIGISEVSTPFLERELADLLEPGTDGNTLAQSMRLDALLQNPSGTPGDLSRERQHAVLAYLDEYLRLGPA